MKFIIEVYSKKGMLKGYVSQVIQTISTKNRVEEQIVLTNTFDEAEVFDTLDNVENFKRVLTQINKHFIYDIVRHDPIVIE